MACKNLRVRMATAVIGGRASDIECLALSKEHYVNADKFQAIGKIQI